MPIRTLRKMSRSPKYFPLVASLYPPLLGAGIRVRSVSPDWTRGVLHMYVRPWTANMHGAAFGGALFSATDVLVGMLIAGQLGRECDVWTRTATIEFVAPGRGKLTCVVTVTAEQAAEIRAEIDRKGRALSTHEARIVDQHGATVALATHTMHISPRTPR